MAFWWFCAATVSTPLKTKASRKISWDADGQRTPSAGGGGGGERSDAVLAAAFAAHTTRLSSVSSNMSATSGLSALSSFSRRSPSPHRMLLETSFCGARLTAGDADSLKQGPLPPSFSV